MSDLQCAATLVLAAPSERAEALALGERLAMRRIAAVWTGDGASQRQTAELVAGVLGLPVTARPGLDALDPGDAGDDRGALQEIADQHRGETVLVLLPASPVAGLRLGPDEIAELRIDGDGWVLA